MKEDYLGYWKSFEDMISSWNFSHGEQENVRKKIYGYLNDVIKYSFNKKEEVKVMFEGLVDNPLSGFSYIDKINLKDPQNEKDDADIDIRMAKENNDVPIYLLFRPRVMTVAKDIPCIERRILMINDERKPYFSNEANPEIVIGNIADKVIDNLRPFKSISQVDTNSAVIFNFYEANSPIIIYSKNASFAEKENDPQATKILKRIKRQEIINKYITSDWI